MSLFLETTLCCTTPPDGWRSPWHYSSRQGRSYFTWENPLKATTYQEVVPSYKTLVFLFHLLSGKSQLSLQWKHSTSKDLCGLGRLLLNPLLPLCLLTLPVRALMSKQEMFVKQQKSSLWFWFRARWRLCFYLGIAKYLFNTGLHRLLTVWNQKWFARTLSICTTHTWN